jgi:hypothetical protein
MGFWKTFGKYAIPAAAIAATAFTGGAAAPLIGMAIGAGGGLATSKLSGASWKTSLINAGIGGGLGYIGGGALKGMGGFGKLATQATKYAPAIAQGAKGFTGGAQQTPGMGAPPSQYSGGAMPQGQGYLNPIGLQTQRRTSLSGMGTRDYA